MHECERRRSASDSEHPGTWLRKIASLGLAAVTSIAAVVILSSASAAQPGVSEAEEPLTQIDIPAFGLNGARVKEGLLVVDTENRPVHTAVGGEEIVRCTDAACSSLETSPTDGLRIFEMLADDQGGIVLIGRPELWGGYRLEDVQVVVRRCRAGAQGFCDPDASEQATLTAADLGGTAANLSGGLFPISDALLDGDGRLVLLSSKEADFDRHPGMVKLVRCADALCSTLLAPPLILETHDDRRGTGLPAHLGLGPDDSPFVVRQGNPTVTTISCLEPLCATTEVNEYDRGQLGFEPSEIYGVQLYGLALTPAGIGAAVRPVILTSTGDETRIVDCVSFVCSAPQTHSLETGVQTADYNSTALGYNDLGQLVIFAQGFVTVCADDRCRQPTWTEPVAPVFGTQSFALDFVNGHPILQTGDLLLLCEGRFCVRPTEPVAPELEVECHSPSGVYGNNKTGKVVVRYANLSEDPVTYQLRTGAVSRSTVVPPRQTQLAGDWRGITGRPEGPLVITIARNGVDVFTRAYSLACNKPATSLARVACVNGRGRIDVSVAADSAELPATFDVRVGSLTRQVTLTTPDPRGFSVLNQFPNRPTALATVSSRPDGSYDVEVVDTSTGTIVHTQQVTVACTSTPVVEPDPGVQTGAVTIVTSCLAGNGRIDVTVVEQSDGAGIWTISLRTGPFRRQTVAAGDWWRSPVTGRPDGDYEVTVQRNGVVMTKEVVRVECGDQVGQSRVTGSEVTLTSACRAGRGYLLFQFLNHGTDAKSWVLEFDGVPNRSTSAVGFASSVKAVTGRPNGTYGWNVRGQPRQSVTVDC